MMSAVPRAGFVRWGRSNLKLRLDLFFVPVWCPVLSGDVKLVLFGCVRRIDILWWRWSILWWVLGRNAVFPSSSGGNIVRSLGAWRVGCGRSSCCPVLPGWPGKWSVDVLSLCCHILALDPDRPSGPRKGVGWRLPKVRGWSSCWGCGRACGEDKYFARIGNHVADASSVPHVGQTCRYNTCNVV